MRESIILHVLLLFLVVAIAEENKDQVFVVTVASDVNKTGYKHFLKSAKTFDVHVKNICEGDCWNNRGTSTKIFLLRNYLDNLHTDGSKINIILFVDGYDVLFLSGLDEIVRRFKSFPQTQVLFSGDHYCYPHTNYRRVYSNKDRATVYPYLNSGGIIGYLPTFKRILNYSKYYVPKDDDQLYYTLIYLDRPLRKTFKMTLDHNGTVFLTLDGSQKEVEVVNTTTGYLVEHTVTKQRPPIIHGQGPGGRRVMKQLYKAHLHKVFEKGSLSNKTDLNNTEVKDKKNSARTTMRMHVNI